MSWFILAETLGTTAAATDWQTFIQENMGSWVTILTLLFLAAQKAWPQYFPAPKPPEVTPVAPADPNKPVVVDPNTPANPIISPAERPLISLLIKMLPVLLPALLKAEKEEEEKAKAEARKS